MPPTDIGLGLTGWSSVDTDLVRNLLQAQLDHLELGLPDGLGHANTIEHGCVLRPVHERGAATKRGGICGPQ